MFMEILSPYAQLDLFNFLFESQFPWKKGMVILDRKLGLPNL